MCSLMHEEIMLNVKSISCKLISSVTLVDKL